MKDAFSSLKYIFAYLQADDGAGKPGDKPESGANGERNGTAAMEVEEPVAAEKQPIAEPDDAAVGDKAMSDGKATGPSPAAAAAMETDDGAKPTGNGFGLVPSGNEAPIAPEAAPEGTMKKPEAAAQKQPAASKAAKAPKDAKKPGKPRFGGALTMADISQDALTQLADQTWSAGVVASGDAPQFDPELVKRIYADELGGGRASPHPRRVALLELSQYLENYLWPGYDADAASAAHVMSIVLMVNEKFKEGLPAWDAFASKKVSPRGVCALSSRILLINPFAKSKWIDFHLNIPRKLNVYVANSLSFFPSSYHLLQDAFKAFFANLLALSTSLNLTPTERLGCLTFLTNVFQSLENEMVRAEVLKLVGLPLWHALSPGRLQLELHAHPQLTRHWKHLAKKEGKAAAAAGEGYVPIQYRSEVTFLPSLISDFFGRLAAATEGTTGNADAPAVRYCERFVQFLSDLLSQLPTRRFVHALLDDKAVLIKCYMSSLYRHPDGELFRQLVESLRTFISFPIDDHTGDALSEDAVTARHYEHVQQLQRLIFKHIPKLQDAALTTCGTLAKRDVLSKFLALLSPEELRFLVTKQLRLVDEADAWVANPEFLVEVMVSAYERRRPLREAIEAMPLYPTETVLLDERQVPGEGAYAGVLDGTLALPKLNLQFLTLHDYFIRNFELFRLEAAYEVREDVADVVRRTLPYLAEDDSVQFGGWARMAQTIQKFAVVEVRKPRIGETRPAAVTAEIVIDTRYMRPDVRAEWDQLKQHDVMFLLGLQPDALAPRQHQRGSSASEALKAAGLRHVRGCEVIEVRDQGEL